MAASKDLMNPQNVCDNLARLIVAVITRTPIQFLGPIDAAVHLALFPCLPLDAAAPLGSPHLDAIAPETSRRQHGEELLHDLISPTPEFLAVVGRRDRDGDGLLDH